MIISRVKIKFTVILVAPEVFQHFNHGDDIENNLLRLLR